MDVIAGLAAVNQAITVAKTLRGIDKAVDQAMLRHEIAELMDKLCDLKIAMTEAKEALDSKDAEIERLKKNFEAHAQLVEGWNGFKYKADASGNPVGHPCCPSCEIDSWIVFLKPESRGAKCPRCKETFSRTKVILTAEEDAAEKQARAKLSMGGNPRQLLVSPHSWMGR